MLSLDMKAFHLIIPDVIFGNGTIAQIGSKVKEMGADSVVICTDKGLSKTGVVNKVEYKLADQGVSCRTFDRVEPEPSLDNVLDAVEFAKEGDTGVVVGLGGGSSMDVSKFVSIMLKHKGEIRDYLGIDNIPGRGLPTIMVPTTAGTGSEVSKYSIFDDREAKTKLGAVSFHLMADLALIDPELTISMPPFTTAVTGCDALIHAVEGYLATNATPITDLLALESLRLIFRNLPPAYADGRDPLARYNMAYGSFLAGIVLNHAGGSSSHALSYPVASEYHIAHGAGCMLTFFEVLEYFMPCSIEKFVAMAEVIGVDTSMGSPREIAEKAIIEMRKMAAYFELPTNLSFYGIQKKQFKGYAESIVANQQRLITNGPRQMSVEDIISIYERSY